MPDLSIEYRWCCLTYHNWRLAQQFSEGCPEPDCDWDEEYDGGEPVDGKCPKCGGEITSYQIGV